ncbi:MAG: hypothetical protein AAGC67_16140 [Myxococcota bacterium]
MAAASDAAHEATTRSLPTTTTTRAAATRPGVLRCVLLLGCAIAAAAPLAWADPTAAAAHAPDLARLLRGMALVKAVFVTAGAALLLWRFGHPIARKTAALYLVAVWAGASATTMIWGLAQLVGASVLFHAAFLLVVLLAIRDGLPPERFARDG